MKFGDFRRNFGQFHGKWPFGGSPGLPPRSWQQYLTEVPLLEHKSRQSWRQKIGDLRATLKTLGREDFFLANNEYGLGKGSAFAGTFTRFQNGLVVVELALEMYASGYDIACFWVNAQLSLVGVLTTVQTTNKTCLLYTSPSPRDS